MFVLDFFVAMTTATAPEQNATTSVYLFSARAHPLSQRVFVAALGVLSFLGNGLFCCVFTSNYKVWLVKAHNVIIFVLAITDTLAGLSPIVKRENTL